MNYLPKGFRDYVFERAEALDAAKARVAATFAAWGYRRFVPSMVEDAETFAQGAEGQLLRDSFRFTDRSGELLVLRPDMTLQAARALAGELSAAPPPIRLFYADRVFRNGPEGMGALREVWQAGVELAGVQAPEADAEIVAVALEALTALGVTDLQVDLGHSGFIREFLAAAKLPQKSAAQLIDALERKDVRALEDLRSQGTIDAATWQTASKLVNAFGLTSVADLTALGLSLAAVNDLKDIADVLKAYGVSVRLTFDPGEVRGLDYYTGFFFHVYAQGVGRPLAAGGRYDGLIAKYGRDLPAVGCAVDLETVMGRTATQRGFRVHIINLREERGGALGLARDLRAKGMSVSRDIVRRPWEESLAFARQAGMDWVVVLEPKDKMRLIEVASGKETAMEKAEQIVQRVSP